MLKYNHIIIFESVSLRFLNCTQVVIYYIKMMITKFVTTMCGFPLLNIPGTCCKVTHLGCV